MTVLRQVVRKPCALLGYPPPGGGWGAGCPFAAAGQRGGAAALRRLGGCSSNRVILAPSSPAWRCCPKTERGQAGTRAPSNPPTLRPIESRTSPSARPLRRGATGGAGPGGWGNYTVNLTWWCWAAGLRDGSCPPEPRLPRGRRVDHRGAGYACRARDPGSIASRASPGLPALASASRKTASVAVKPCTKVRPPMGPISPPQKHPAIGA